VHIFHHGVKEQDETGKSQEPHNSKHYTLKKICTVTPPLASTFTNKLNRTADTSKTETPKWIKFFSPHHEGIQEK